MKRFGIILTILSLWVGCDEAEEAIEEELCVTESQALTAADLTQSFILSDLIMMRSTAIAGMNNNTGNGGGTK